jgi:uncharacterized protein (TIGR03437 family)
MSLRILFPLFALAGTLSAQITEVRNGASYGPELTAGSWAFVKGTFPGLSTTGVVNNARPITTSFSGATVKVGTIHAPVWYVSNVQINFLVPAALAPGQYPIEVNNGTTTFNSTVQLISAAPGIFQRDTNTPPQGAVVDNATAAINDSTHPTSRGGVILIFATGPGKYQTQETDGAIPAGTNPTRSTPELYIGGVLVPPSDISYSGQGGGNPGLWQINAKVPNLPFITGRMPMVLFMDGVPSNEVSIFVQ